VLANGPRLRHNLLLLHVHVVAVIVVLFFLFAEQGVVVVTFDAKHASLVFEDHDRVVVGKSMTHLESALVNVIID
jgi:hypothetical protein